MGSLRYELEIQEHETVVTAVIAALCSVNNYDVEQLKARIIELKLGELLHWEYEHELSDDFVEKCQTKIKGFYS